MRKWILVISLFLGTLHAISQQSERWEVSGYMKSMQTIVSGTIFEDYLFDQLFHHRLRVGFHPGDHWSFYWEQRTRMFLGDAVRMTDDYGRFIDRANNDHFDMSLHIVDRNSFVWNTTVDRLYAEFVKGKWELAAGRQRINWGIASFWNPNDLFNATSFTDFDYEEGPGSDAVRLSFFPGNRHNLQLAGKMTDDWDEAVLALLYKVNWNTYDLQFLTGRFMTDYVIGGGWAGNLRDAGFKGEWAVFLPQDSGDPVEWNLTAGLDHGWQNGMYVNAGYLYTSRASNNLGDIWQMNFTVNARDLYLFRHNVYVSWMFPATPLLSLSVTSIFSPVEDMPMFIMPMFTYSAAENWDVDVVGQLLLGHYAGSYRLVTHGYFFRVKYSY